MFEVVQFYNDSRIISKFTIKNFNVNKTFFNYLKANVIYYAKAFLHTTFIVKFFFKYLLNMITFYIDLFQ